MKVSIQSILCIDDEPMFLRMMEMVFKKTGAEVYKASSWPEAEKIIGKHEIEVVLCDIHLEGMGGSEIGRHLSETYPEIGVVFFSSLTDQELQEIAEEVGALGWINKSLSPRQWPERLGTLLKEGRRD